MVSWADVPKLQLFVAALGASAIGSLSNTYIRVYGAEIYFFVVVIVCFLGSCILMVGMFVRFVEKGDAIVIVANIMMAVLLGVGWILFLISTLGVHSALSAVKMSSIIYAFKVRRVVTLVLEAINTLLYLLMTYQAYSDYTKNKQVNVAGGIPYDDSLFLGSSSTMPGDNNYYGSQQPPPITSSQDGTQEANNIKERQQRLLDNLVRQFTGSKPTTGSVAQPENHAGEYSSPSMFESGFTYGVP